MEIKRLYNSDYFEQFKNCLKEYNIELMCTECTLFSTKKKLSHNIKRNCKPRIKKIRTEEKANWKSRTPIKIKPIQKNNIHSQFKTSKAEENISNQNTDIKKHSPSYRTEADNGVIEKGKFNIRQLFEDNFKTPLKLDDSPICTRLKTGNILGQDYKAGFLQLTEVKQEFGDWESLRDGGIEQSDHGWGDRGMAFRGSPSPFQSPFISFQRNKGSQSILRSIDSSKVQRTLDFLDNPFTAKFQ